MNPVYFSFGPFSVFPITKLLSSPSIKMAFAPKNNPRQLIKAISYYVAGGFLFMSSWTSTTFKLKGHTKTKRWNV